MKIAMIGYGKMGKTIEKLATAQGHEVTLKIGSKNKDDLNITNLQSCDVAIEFSLPSTAYGNIITCMEAGVPVVSGTTAWLDKLEEVELFCQKHDGAFFYASNYSIGVNIFFALNKKLAQLMNPLNQYDIEMEEIHHTQKLDAPSGTAITLANDIIENIDRKKNWINNPPIADKQLVIHSKRIDEVPGTHTVQYHSDFDDIRISHIAHSRQGFALGAIKAAEWIIGRKGFFGMRDLLKIDI